MEYFRNFSNMVIDRLSGRHTPDDLPDQEAVTEIIPEMETLQPAAIEVEKPKLLFQEQPNERVYPHFIVVADSESEVGKLTANFAKVGATIAAKEAGHVDKIENNFGESRVVSDATDLFRYALSGNNGKPASAVLLDHAYFKEKHKWVSSIEVLTQIAEESGKELLPNSVLQQLRHPNCINFAVLLRSLGFEGQIFAVSSSPPDVREVNLKLKQINSGLHHEIPFPLNGYVNKRPFCEFALYANRVGINHWESEDIDGGLPAAFAKIFAL